MRRTIFLDVDGVLADFVAGAAKLHGTTSHALAAVWPADVYDMVEVLGISQAAFWKPINEAGADFWSALDPLDNALWLYAELRKIAPVVLLTSPSHDASSTAGKVAWIQRVFGSGFRDYLIGPSKHACAHHRSVLVDDFDQNVGKFSEHGGIAVLYPQLWNSRRAQRWDAHEIAVHEVRAHIECMETRYA